MAKDIVRTAEEYIDNLTLLLREIDKKELRKAEKLLAKTYQNKGKVLIIGNGGSASTATHMACDLSKGVMDKSKDEIWLGFRAIPLTENISVITAWSNDIAYEKIFSEQIKNLGKKGDLLIAISSSGNSENIINGVLEAREVGMSVITISGFGGGKLSSMGDASLVTHHYEYGQVEDIQLVFNHIFSKHFYDKFNS
jgi:D-sedoheptulose 7-phosphate isomerase